MRRFALYLPRCVTREASSSSSLSHVDYNSRMPKMVDVSSKNITTRSAKAIATVRLPSEITKMISVPHNAHSNNEIFAKKGPVFSTAVITGVMAAKKTSDLIPFCHPIPLEGCDIDIQLTVPEMDSSKNSKEAYVTITCISKTSHKTGVEMEAIVGANAAALCIYDMLKAVSHDIEIISVKLVEKSGGKSDYKNL